jgi:hypothetical protein
MYYMMMAPMLGQIIIQAVASNLLSSQGIGIL